MRPVLVYFTVFTFNLFLWHSPPLYQGVLHSEPLHVLEHLLFIGTGMLLWMPLFGPLPKPQWFGKGAHVIYTVGICLPAMVLANVLMWSDVDIYPDSARTALANGIEPIADQSTGDAILMVECMLAALAIFAWVFLRWAKEETEQQDLLDLAYERGVEPARGTARLPRRLRRPRARYAGQRQEVQPRASRDRRDRLAARPTTGTGKGLEGLERLAETRKGRPRGDRALGRHLRDRRRRRRPRPLLAGIQAAAARARRADAGRSLNGCRAERSASR